MDKSYVESEAAAWTLRATLLCVVAFILNLILIVSVELKEDPFFWRNAGGFPIWLRDLVLMTFYPLLIAQFIALTAGSICQFRAYQCEKIFRAGGPLALMLLWLFFAIILAILVSNNVDNLLNGRDLHYHPG